MRQAECVSDSIYKSRCLKRLRELELPTEGWFCEWIEDTDEPEAVCELCGCARVRFLHHMRHPMVGHTIAVGCLCDGIMSGDELGAYEREREARNRAKRRQTFIHGAWRALVLPLPRPGDDHLRAGCQRAFHSKRPEKETDMRERQIEQRLTQAVRQRQGLGPKWVSPGLDGVPDRIILLPGGRIAFAELKAPGRPLRPLQRRRKAQLEALGFRVYVIDNQEQIGGVLDALSAP